MNSIKRPGLAGPILRKPALAKTSTIQEFRQEAVDRLGTSEPAKVELGALLLWERKVAETASKSDKAYTPEVGAMNGYLTTLAWTMGMSQGALSPAILEAAKDFRPEHLMHRQESNGFTYLGTISADDQWQVAQKMDNEPTTCHGVPCVGFWNQKEKDGLLPALGKLSERAPHLYSQLKGVTLQTWLGSTEPTWNLAPQADGTYNSGSPGMLKLARNIFLDPTRLEHVIFHEFGHVVDARENDSFQSNRVKAFSGTQSKASCVSEYAMTSRPEDMAETFAFAVQHYDNLKSHPDLYFHGLGELSEKFKYVWKDVLKQDVPEASPAFLEMKRDMKAGNSPFGWVSSDGKIEQTNQEMRPILRDIALNWKLDNVAKNLEWKSKGRERDMYEFVAERLLGLQPSDPAASRPPTLGEIASDLKMNKALKEQLLAAEARVEPIEKTCKELVERDTLPGDVPAEHTQYVGFLYGQKAMDSKHILDKMEVTPEAGWHKLAGETEGSPADLKARLEARSEELMERYSELSERNKTENVPQSRENASDEAFAARCDSQRLEGKLRSLFTACDVHLRKNLTQHCAATGQQELMELYSELAPKH